MPLVIPLERCIARPPEGAEEYLLIEHLLDVAQRSGNADGDPYEQLLFLAGLLHDAGKAQTSWQRYIREPVRRRGSVPHAFLGSALFFVLALCLRSEYARRYPQDMEQLDGAILQLTADLADHHRELKNLDETVPPWETGWRPDSLKETDLDGLLGFVRSHFPPISRVPQISSAEIPNLLKQAPRQWRRMVIVHQSRRFDTAEGAGKDVVAKRLRTATLIGADRFAVAGVMPRCLTPEEASSALARLIDFCRSRGRRLDSKHKSTLTALRQRAQDDVVAKYLATPPAQFYTLRMATGMGKTLAALRTGLEACRLGRGQRIVYVAPYLTILSQAADEIRDATGLEVMEHHHLSVLKTYASHESDPQDLLLQESWQAPIVATTFNQLFRALSPRYAQETIRVGGLHKAFLILDEPQAVDGDVWRLFLSLLEAFARQHEMTVLMITATTPPLDDLRDKPVDLTPKEIPTPHRYNVRLSNEEMDDEALAEELANAVGTHRMVAAILNTIEDAGRVYERTKQFCGSEVGVYTLHGAMTSLHKKYQITEIRGRLELKLPTIVVATQIIEAGVDLSFRRIYRARPIIPSIIQAAGRANRHGADGEPLADVIDFHFLREGKETRQFVYNRIATRVSDELLGPHQSISEPEMPNLCDRYFEEVFRRKPGTSALAYLRDAALGRWSDLQNISPFQEKDYRISVFVPNDGPWVDDETREFLARFGVENPAALYELYVERNWMRELSFLERKAFLGLMQRFIVPLAYRLARMISNLGEAEDSGNVPAICLLRQPHLYKEDSGFGSLVQDLDEWIYL